MASGGETSRSASIDSHLHFIEMHSCNARSDRCAKKLAALSLFSAYNPSEPLSCSSIISRKKRPAWKQTKLTNRRREKHTQTQMHWCCKELSLVFFRLPVPRSPGHPCISHWGKGDKWVGGWGRRGLYAARRSAWRFLPLKKSSSAVKFSGAGEGRRKQVEMKE